MKKHLLTICCKLVLTLLILVPSTVWGAVNPVADISAKLVDNHIQLTFTKSADANNYLLLRRSDKVVMNNANIPILLNGSTYPANSVISGWEVMPSGSYTSGQVNLPQSDYTYLFYMRKNNEYSAPKSIFINNSLEEKFVNGINYDFYIQNSPILEIFKVTDIKSNQKLEVLKGTFLLSSTLNVEGKLSVSQNVDMKYKTGNDSGITIKENGLYDVYTNYWIGKQHTFIVEKNGTVNIWPSVKFGPTQNGFLYIKDGAKINMYGDFEINTTGSSAIIHSNAIITFKNGSNFILNSQWGIPRATWENGSHCTFIGGNQMATIPAGFDQTFFDLTWNTAGNNQVADFIVPKGININGNLYLISTNGRKLSFEENDDIRIKGNLTVSPSSSLTLPAKAIINGDIENSGNISFANSGESLNLNGSLLVLNTGSISLPKVTVINKDLMNNGTVNLAIGGGSLTVKGSSAVSSGAKQAFAPATFLQGSFINYGVITAPFGFDELTINGSLENHEVTSVFPLAKKTYVTSGGLLNKGKLYAKSTGAFDVLSVVGGIQNSSGAQLQLPSTSTITGDFINNGAVTAPNSLAVLDISGSLQHNATNTFPLAKDTYIRSGGLTNYGTMVAPAVFSLLDVTGGIAHTTTSTFPLATNTYVTGGITSNGPMTASAALNTLEVSGGINHNATGTFHLAKYTSIKSGGLINKGIMVPFSASSAYETLLITGTTQNLAGAQLQLPTMTATLTGDLLNSGTITSAASGTLTLTGKLDNAAGANAALPKTAIVEGNLLNAGTASAKDELTVKGILTQNSGSLFLAKKSTVLGDLKSTGTLVVHEQLYLGGSLSTPTGASFNSASQTTRREIHFMKTTDDKISDFSFTKASSAQGSIQKVVIAEGRKVRLASDIQMSGNSLFDVQSNSTLDLGTHIVSAASGSSTSAFTVNDNATLRIGHAGGITASGTSGAIRTETRTFKSKAYYVYNGSVNQVTGSGLPSELDQILVIDNPTTVKLSQNLTSKVSLSLKKGVLDLNGKQLTIEKNLSSETGTLYGNATSLLYVTGNGSVTLPTATLSAMTVKTSSRVDLGGNLTVSKKLVMDDGVLYTNASKVILQRTSETTDEAILEEDKNIFSKGFISGTIETELVTPNGGLLAKNYDMNGIGIKVKFNGQPGGKTYVTRQTGTILDKKGKVKFAERSYQIATTTVNGLNAAVTFQYMLDEFVELLFDSSLKIYKTADGENFEKKSNSTVNLWTQSITVSAIDQFNAGLNAAVSNGAKVASGVAPLATIPFGGQNSASGKFSGLSVIQGSVAAPLEDRPTGSTWVAGSENTPFPVELISFKAMTTPTGEAALTWSTASEINNSHFEVQRSEDGKTWTTLSQVTGKGNTSLVSHYSYTDQHFSNVYSPIVYYRLKQVDFDGTHEFSNTVVLEQQKLGAQFSSIYLNEATGKLEIRYSNLDLNQPVYVVLADSQGRTIVNEQFKLDKRSGMLSIPVSQSVRGLLVVRAASGQIYRSSKLIH